MYFPISDAHREYIGRIVKAFATKAVVFIAVFIDAMILIVETAASKDVCHFALDDELVQFSDMI
jgi:TM2 domain-containing membrane protein YozV